MLITIIVALVVLILVLWAIDTFMPGNTNLKKLLQFLVVLAVILYMLQAAGMWTGRLP